MRVALAAIVLLSGCNWVFGLHPTEREPDPDAPPGGPDAMWSRAELAYLLGPTTSMTQQGAVSSAPLPPDPATAVGPLGGALRPVAYYAVDDTGQVEYPPELVGGAWRLEYTPPGGVTHEVQWAPPGGGGYLVVPEFGRLARVPVPANTGYEVTTASMYTWRTDATFQTVVHTTGYWSRHALTSNGTSIPLDFSTIPSLTGRPSAPSSTGGDQVVVIEYENLTCRRARQAGTFAATPLLDGVRKVELATLQAANNQVSFAFPTLGFTAKQRLATALDGRVGTQADRAIFGRAAHTLLPAFTSEYNGIPAPVFLPLVECPLGVGLITSDTFVDPTATVDLQGLAFSYEINQRTASSATLPSSIASVVTSTTQTFTPNFDVALATGPIRFGMKTLEGDDDVIENAPDLVTFDVELGLPLDYFEVVLYRLGGGARIAERVYVSPNPTEHRITFDPSVMTAGADYVFAIRTYRGRPDALVFDMRTVGPIQAMGNVFSGTFKRL